MVETSNLLNCRLLKVREFESHTFRKIAGMAELGIRSGLRSHPIIGSSPITGTKCTFFRFFKKSQNFFEGNFLVYRENYCIFNI